MKLTSPLPLSPEEISVGIVWKATAAIPSSVPVYIIEQRPYTDQTIVSQYILQWLSDVGRVIKYCDTFDPLARWAEAEMCVPV